MKFFKPSVAKIITTPVIAWLIFTLLDAYGKYDDYYIAHIVDSSSNILILFNLLELFVWAYVIACFIVMYGIRKRRLFIVIVTLVSAYCVFSVCSFLSFFFGFCVTDMSLRCLLGYCNPVDAPCLNTQLFHIPLTTVFFYLSLGLPVLILIIGAVLFKRDGKMIKKK